MGWVDEPRTQCHVYKNPIRKMEDLKGVKMRAGGPQALFHEQWVVRQLPWVVVKFIPQLN